MQEEYALAEELIRMMARTPEEYFLGTGEVLVAAIKDKSRENIGIKLEDLDEPHPIGDYEREEPFNLADPGTIIWFDNLESLEVMQRAVDFVREALNERGAVAS